MREKLFQLKLRRRKKRYERYRREYLLNKAYEQYLPERKKRKVSNILLVIVVTAITIYTVASFWFAHTTGNSIDSTLTTCFYAFWATEVFALAGIRISKVRKNDDSAPYEIPGTTTNESEDDEACG